MKKFMSVLLILLIALVSCSNANVVSVDIEPMLLEGFTIFESELSSRIDSTSETISFEEIVELAVEYILELTDEDFDGLYMQLTYQHDQHLWYGKVAESMNDFEDGNKLLVFQLDARTGERLFFLRPNFEPLYGMDDFVMDRMNETELWTLFPEPDGIEIEEMLEVVQEYARRHFGDTAIIVLEYGFYTFGGAPDTAYLPSQNSPFFAIDNQGRVIEIILQRQTHELLMIIAY